MNALLFFFPLRIYSYEPHKSSSCYSQSSESRRSLNMETWQLPKIIRSSRPEFTYTASTCILSVGQPLPEPLTYPNTRLPFLSPNSPSLSFHILHQARRRVIVFLPNPQLLLLLLSSSPSPHHCFLRHIFALVINLTVSSIITLRQLRYWAIALFHLPASRSLC